MSIESSIEAVAKPDHFGTMIYSSSPELDHPLRLLRSMGRDLVLSRELAWRLTVRDIKAQYRQSLLGYVWAFLPPLLIAASFAFLRSTGFMNVDEVKVSYGAFVITGALLWQIFADAVTSPLRVTTSCRDILVKVLFPREALVLSAMLLTLFGAGIRMIIMVPVMLYFQVPLTGSFLLMPLGVVALTIAGTSLGVLLVPIGLLYKDIERALSPLLMLWLLIIPVAYPFSNSGANWFHHLNFVVPLIDCTRFWIIGGATSDTTAFFAVLVGAIAVLLVGWLLFRLAFPHLIARLGV